VSAAETPGARTPRVVSLVPSASETLVALGVVPVACTRFCERAGVPTVGGTKRPDVPAIVDLAPDLVVVNDEENRWSDAADLIDAGVAVHSMSPRSVHDVGGEVRALAARLEVAVPFPFGGDDWDGWLATVLTPRWYDAFVAVWRRPWMSLASDTYGASLLDVLGVGNVFADSFERYPEVTLEEVAARAPNLVILPSEPYEFGPEHAREIELEVSGVPIAFVDGRDLFWWGIRTPAAAARIAAVLKGRPAV
jgi:ABC-type Fe3+-hydroxamate transport system substrate-binding protein